jgi:hypothetical protein
VSAGTFSNSGHPSKRAGGTSGNLTVTGTVVEHPAKNKLNTNINFFI